MLVSKEKPETGKSCTLFLGAFWLTYKAMEDQTHLISSSAGHRPIKSTLILKRAWAQLRDCLELHFPINSL